MNVIGIRLESGKREKWPLLLSGPDAGGRANWDRIERKRRTEKYLEKMILCYQDTESEKQKTMA